MRVDAVALLMLIAISAGCASGPEQVARMRASEAESAARLSIEGGLLYGADTAKQDGYQYCSLAVGLADRGELRRAIREASKALYLGQTGGDRCLTAFANRDLASAYNFAGYVDRAGQLAAEALQGASSCRNSVVVAVPAYKVLGDVALRQGRPKDAIPLYERALAGASPALQPLARASLGNAYLALGDLTKAKASFQQAETGASPALKPLIGRGLGQVALLEGRKADAAALFEKAAIAASGFDAAYHRLWALDGLARARLAAGDRAAAIDAYQKALAAADDVRTLFRSEEFKTGFFGDVQQIFDRAVALLVDAGQGATAFEVSEKSRARALQDLVRGRITAKAGSEALVDPIRGSVSAIAIGSRMPEGEALVEYHVTDTRTFAWVIRRSVVKTISIELGRDALRDDVRLFRDSIRSRAADADSRGAQLYRILVEPLGLSPSESLVIVPHGVLHYLPFQALRGPGGYLVEARVLSTAPSASTLAALLARDRGSRQIVLALGNPDLGSPGLGLPGAEREVRQIKEFFPQAEIYTGKDATKEHLLARAPESDVVHIGAHADIDEIDPLYSVIRLAGTGTNPGDLEAHEIYGLNLSRVKLATLSACDSGLGRVSRGDELWGFTRSFLGAGARTLVVSLWPVEDVSTSLLMAKFYEELRETNPPRSLRAAQLAILRRDEYHHPFFWAAFTVVGDWR
jgi:CHAT domain-containing protein